MPTLPIIGPNDSEAPHVVIVGAGGSVAACPNGDANGNLLPVMTNIIDVLNLKPILEKHGISGMEANFETVYDDVIQKGNTLLASELERQVYGYFSKLLLPETATDYDYLLLSLRPKDLIATFNWDPLLVQAFKRHEGKISLPQLAFLHGNVAIGCCEKDRRCGRIDDDCGICGKPFKPTTLLYPVRDKQYSSNPFIQSQWELLSWNLNRAYFLTIFGYSAPATDVAAREVMMKAWKRNTTQELAQINIIDIKPEEDVEQNWNDFITRSHYGTSKTIKKSYLARFPRRSCDALFEFTMMCNTWKDNRFPEFTSYEKLRDWVKPLYQEECFLHGTKEYFSGKTCEELRTHEIL